MEIPIADLHVDTASKLFDGRSLYDNNGMVSIKKMIEGFVRLQFFAMFIFMADFKSYDEGYNHLKKMNDLFMEEASKNKEHLSIVKTYEHITQTAKSNKIAGLTGLEEGGIIDNKPGRVRELYDMGIRLITLLWNFENCIGYPNSDDSNIMNARLKDFGFEVISLMDELGMLIDVSHLSDRGFFDVLEAAKNPVVASHSNARTVFGHRRNLSDKMLRTLSEKGGVVGLNFYDQFLGAGGSRIEKITAHAKHIHNIAGIDVLSMGSDFDGFDDEGGFVDCTIYPSLTDSFLRAGFSYGEIEKICYGNVMRVLREVLKT